MNEFDFSFNMDLDLELEPMFENGFDNRYKKAKGFKEPNSTKVNYRHAAKMVDGIKIEKGSRYDCIVSGNFIFGDFLEAFVVKNNCRCKRLMISTLSMSQDNIDSLANLLNGGFVDKLDMIVSDHFYAHEQNCLIPYVYEVLDIDNKFQLSAARTHTKITLFETYGGKKIVIHGSANLRSSGNIEQFTIEENEGLYDFWLEYHDRIVEKYSLINHDIEIVQKKKSLGIKDTWKMVTNDY